VTRKGEDWPVTFVSGLEAAFTWQTGELRLKGNIRGRIGDKKGGGGITNLYANLKADAEHMNEGCSQRRRGTDVAKVL